MSTKILNQTNPLGSVTVKFTDGDVTFPVNTIGETEFDPGNRVLVSVELFGNTYAKPGSYPFQYPNGTWGECSFSDTVAHGYIIWVN